MPLSQDSVQNVTAPIKNSRLLAEGNDEEHELSNEDREAFGARYYYRY